jgi:hypothetical protein
MFVACNGTLMTNRIDDKALKYDFQQDSTIPPLTTRIFYVKR